MQTKKPSNSEKMNISSDGLMIPPELKQLKNPPRAVSAFKKALCDLLVHTSFENITLKMIVEKSTYSYTSFYSYFRDKYDLLEKMLDDEITAYMEILTATQELLKTEGDTRIANLSDPRTMYRTVTFYKDYHYFKRIYDNRYIYHALFKCNIIPLIHHEFCKRMTKRLTMEVAPFNVLEEMDFSRMKVSRKELEQYLFFVEPAITCESIIFWMRNNFSYTPYQMAQMRFAISFANMPVHWMCKDES